MEEKKKLRGPFVDSPPSEKFIEAFLTSEGSPRKDCGACGRTSFDTSGDGSYDEGEYDKLLTKQAEDADRYISYRGTIRTFRIGGIEAVVGCPCNYGRYVENLVINDAPGLIRYYKSRAEDMRREAVEIVQQADAIESLPDELPS